MKILTVLISLLVSALSNFGPEMIVPSPADLVIEKGQLNVAGMAVWVDPAFEAEATDVVADFARKLGDASGKPSAMASSRLEKGFNFELDPSYAPEQYSLSVGKKCVNVKASSFSGLLWAVRSIEQMLPIAIYSGESAPRAQWALKRCTINDQPRFGHRGMMLDVSRYFFSVEEVKKVIDLMSIYKMNRLHWHLTDDQGWRIEIKKYPRLTEVGAWRRGTQIGRDRNTCDNVPHGGFYTQDQIREVVKYAAQRGVQIMPEIDLPGHMLGALAAYPELGCTGGPYEVCTIWGISKDVLCPGKEATFEFLQNVLDEVADLFPYEYFHIGGDECPTDRWEKCPDCQKRIAELGLVSKDGVSAERMLQRYVVERLKTFLEQSKGKKVVCWDEVLKTEPDKKTAIMIWTGMDNIERAARRRYKVILTPKWYCYTDYRQAEEGEPIGQPRVVTLEKLYSFEPSDFIAPGQEKYILGVQINHWSEYFPTPEHMEYMLCPRLQAASEVQWCPRGSKDLPRLKHSLSTHQFPLLQSLGYNYRPLK